MHDAEFYFGQFMRSLGMDLTDPHLADTPKRVAALYRDVFTPEGFTFTTFPSDGTDQMIVVRGIPFNSFCAHHWLPFTGVAHVAYIPRDRIVGLSKIPRAVKYFAARPQVQERLTEQIADFLQAQLDPLGVGVSLEARHECMELRGVRSIGALTQTSALRGVIFDDPRARSEFYDMVRK
jgi:GTP cyclohydrolase I